MDELDLREFPLLTELEEFCSEGDGLVEQFHDELRKFIAREQLKEIGEDDG